MDKTNKVGDFLRQFRKEKDNMSLRELSKKTGISFSHLSKIERGEHTPSKTTLDIIAENTDIDRNELYLLSGYAPDEKLGIGLEHFFSGFNSEDRKNLDIIDKISKEFPDADLMFSDLEGMSFEQLQEVYDFIKFKKSQS